MPAHRPIEERFWEKVDASGDCWEWTGARSHGYGSFHPDGVRSQPAHQVAWELLIGPKPPGLEMDHLCRNPPCVNPAHLEWVTHRENNRRGYGFSGLARRKTSCSNGHPYTEETTRLYVTARGTSRQCRACFRMYGARFRTTNPESPEERLTTATSRVPCGRQLHHKRYRCERSA